MKVKFNIKVTLILATVLFIFACSSDDNNSNSEGTNDLGTFKNYLQVVDDPQTSIGYITNAVASVSVSGSTATIKITGDNGFNREYTASVISSSGSITNLTLNKQTKPIEKVASGLCGILNNQLTIDINLASDAVTVKPSTTASTTFEKSGKLKIFGGDFIKQ